MFSRLAISAFSELILPIWRDGSADEYFRRGMAAYVGRDVAKLKAKGGGKWKYMSEKY